MGETGERSRWSFWQWLGLAFVLYVIPAVIFGIDAEFFDGRLFTSLGDEGMAFVKFVYWPCEAIGKLWDHD